jgi:hypothetical protein
VIATVRDNARRAAAVRAFAVGSRTVHAVPNGLIWVGLSRDQPVGLRGAGGRSIARYGHGTGVTLAEGISNPVAPWLEADWARDRPLGRRVPGFRPILVGRFLGWHRRSSPVRPTLPGEHGDSMRLSWRVWHITQGGAPLPNVNPQAGEDITGNRSGLR